MQTPVRSLTTTRKPTVASKHMNFVVTCSQVFSISTLHGHVTFSQRYDLALVLLSNYLYRQSDTSDVVELSLVKP